ncbi:MAG: C10 family peptidase [Candidatus Cloacimonetes bacterium]|nr:C10 family peptidase [Candidatus Cloacimonadota bacterium]
MKKIIMFLALAAVFSLLIAVPVTENSSRAIAEFHLQIQDKPDYTIGEVFNLTNTEGNLVAYVYHLNPVGYIIVGVDTDLPPVVGYSFRDEFLTEEGSNLGYQFVRSDLSKRLAARELTSPEILSGNNENWEHYLNNDLASFQMRDRVIYPPSGYSDTEGWVDLLWDQGYPWNGYCPYDDVNGGRCVTGCVATALSMILAYHEYIGDASFTDADDYASSYEGLYVLIDNQWEIKDFPDFPTLNGYLAETQEFFSGVDPISDHIKATLNFAAGVSVHMKYSNVASGAQVYYPGHNDVRDALLDKFGYDTAQGIYGSSPQLYPQFEDDMQNGRPIMIAILGGSEGHAILVDGWNSGDNTYHLNFGWAGYDNGWYSLPYGMPAGYNEISSAITNVEAGGTLFDLFALVGTNDGTVPANADIEFRGTRLYEGNLDTGGSFSFDYMHEGTYQVTVTYENPGGGYYYKSETFDLNDNNDFLMVTLDAYTELTGSVSGVGNPANTLITFYNDEGEIMSSGVTDTNGDYSIMGLFPDTYIATASWGDNYFAVQEVDVTATQQNFDFVLTEYPYHYALSYNGTTGDIFHLVPNTISCAIKLTSDELAGLEGTAINRIVFKSPINMGQGQLWGQVWIGNNLVSEKAIDNFYYGGFVDVTLDNFVPVYPTADYFVGFKVQSINGDVAWFDTTPREEGKGAWFRINSWTQVNPNNDHNFVIAAHGMSETVDGDETNVIPAVTALGKNYPNPFNPETNIEFSLAEAGEVNVDIYNIKGQKIKTLASGNYEKGAHILHWNGQDDAGAPSASGVYFYKMKSGRYTSTKKMILMK